MHGCWECGAPCPEGVCVGPHEDYALRGVKGGEPGPRRDADRRIPVGVR